MFFPEFDSGWPVDCGECREDSAPSWAGSGWPEEDRSWSCSPPPLFLPSPTSSSETEVSINPVDEANKLLVKFVEELVFGSGELCEGEVVGVVTGSGSEADPYIVE